MKWSYIFVVSLILIGCGGEKFVDISHIPKSASNVAAEPQPSPEAPAAPIVVAVPSPSVAPIPPPQVPYLPQDQVLAVNRVVVKGSFLCLAAELVGPDTGGQIVSPLSGFEGLLPYEIKPYIQLKDSNGAPIDFEIAYSVSHPINAAFGLCVQFAETLNAPIVISIPGVLTEEYLYSGQQDPSNDWIDSVMN